MQKKIQHNGPSPRPTMCRCSAVSSLLQTTKEPDQCGQIHAIETDALIQESLSEFDRLLSLLDFECSQYKAVRDAINHPGLVTNDFKLLFLRCDVFRVKDSVDRFAVYWKKRVSLFGPYRAFSDLTIRDVYEEQDAAALNSGVIRYLEGAQDHQGRSIVFFDMSLQQSSLGEKHYSSDSMCRVLWYHVHLALQSESAQRYGVILMSDPSNASITQFDRSLVQLALGSLQKAIPIRLAGLHVCKPPSTVGIVLPIFKLFLSERLRQRLMLHRETASISIPDQLAKHGIGKEAIPTQLGGTFEV